MLLPSVVRSCGRFRLFRKVGKFVTILVDVQTSFLAVFYFQMEKVTFSSEINTNDTGAGTWGWGRKPRPCPSSSPGSGADSGAPRKIKLLELRAVCTEFCFLAGAGGGAPRKRKKRLVSVPGFEAVPGARPGAPRQMGSAPSPCRDRREMEAFEISRSAQLRNFIYLVFFNSVFP